VFVHLDTVVGGEVKHQIARVPTDEISKNRDAIDKVALCV
jgi:hypothetical protein